MRRALACSYAVAACSFALLAIRNPAAPAGGAQTAPAPTANYKISGTVVNAITQESLVNARVFLRLTSNRTRFITMLTSDSGRFEFDDVPAGKFSLEARARGFLDAAYNQHERFSTAIVTGAGIPTEGLVVGLMPLASINGNVLDERGEPVRNANVSLFIESHRDGMIRTVRAGFAATDDLGTFEFPRPWPVFPVCKSPCLVRRAPRHVA